MFIRRHLKQRTKLMPWVYKLTSYTNHNYVAYENENATHMTEADVNSYHVYNYSAGYMLEQRVADLCDDNYSKDYIEASLRSIQDTPVWHIYSQLIADKFQYKNLYSASISYKSPIMLAAISTYSPAQIDGLLRLSHYSPLLASTALSGYVLANLRILLLNTYTRPEVCKNPAAVSAIIKMRQYMSYAKETLANCASAEAEKMVRRESASRAYYIIPHCVIKNKGMVRLAERYINVALAQDIAGNTSMVY
jgi:hypothetical protein